MKLVWTEPAFSSLTAIRGYIAADNLFYADVFVARWVAAAESLDQLPERGCMVPELA